MPLSILGSTPSVHILKVDMPSGRSLIPDQVFLADRSNLRVPQPGLLPFGQSLGEIHTVNGRQDIDFGWEEGLSDKALGEKVGWR
ncbi:MAG TPA: hypothetical protein VKU19_05800 [Bryobacteraceae bacterium]|nr:hypothetical protein [Bryobacteraceae bacterium]